MNIIIKKISESVNFLLKDLKSVRKKGTFAQNFAFAFTGNTLYVIIQLISAPILSRVYSPEAYGLFGIFNAIITNIAMAGTLMYPNALILPKEKSRFMHMVHLIFILVMATSIFSFFLVVFFGDFLLESIDAGHLSPLKYLIPIGVFIVGINKIATNWVVRIKAFKKSMQVGPPTSLTIKGSTILFGVLTHGAAYGIALIDLAGKFLGFFVNFFFIIRKSFREHWEKLRIKNIKKIANEYDRFPKYVFPSAYMNMFSSQLPVYFISFYFGSLTLGLFAFATSLLDMPMRLLGNAVTPVFYQKATETYHSNPKELKTITIKLFNRLLMFGIVPFSFLAIYGDLVFKIIFGDQWTIAGTFAGYMSVYYFFRLISGPISSIFNVLKKEVVLLRFQLFLLFIRGISLGTGIFVFDSPKLTILLYSIFSGIAYIILNFITFRLLKVSIIKNLIITIALLLISLGFMLFFRYVFL